MLNVKFVLLFESLVTSILFELVHDFRIQDYRKKITFSKHLSSFGVESTYCKNHSLSLSQKMLPSKRFYWFFSFPFFMNLIHTKIFLFSLLTVAPPGQLLPDRLHCHKPLPRPSRTPPCTISPSTA